MIKFKNRFEVWRDITGTIGTHSPMTAISSKSESIGPVNLLYIVRAGSLQVVTTGKKNRSAKEIPCTGWNRNQVQEQRTRQPVKVTLQLF